jgi:hypothetical protein
MTVVGPGGDERVCPYTQRGSTPFSTVFYYIFVIVVGNRSSVLSVPVAAYLWIRNDLSQL